MNGRSRAAKKPEAGGTPTSGQKLWTSRLGFCYRNLLQAGATGFEPAISGLTGRYVRPLHHAPTQNYDTTKPGFRQIASSEKWAAYPLSRKGAKKSMAFATAWQAILALRPWR